jgi:Response regulators consisting of a CheY-like receiver domain and a winged-helix DNA-binding domain
MKPRIVVVEDGEGLRLALVEALEAQGYAASGFMSADAILGAVPEPPFDLAILDIMMPGTDGVQLCSIWRSRGRTQPMIFLSAKGSDFDKVHALESGGDDFLTKPFSMMELLCRVRVCLRRSQAGVPAEAPGPGLCFDDDGFRCWANGSDLGLTVSEYRILAAASRGAKKVYGREELMTIAYPEDPYISDRNADAHIKRIRRKLKEAGLAEDAIQTVYGLGYRFELPR